MKCKNLSVQAFNPVAFATGVLLLFVAVLMTPVAMAITVNVVENDGVTPVNGFRWILQQDATFPVDPASPSSNPDELLSLGFHRSYHPVAQNGNVDTGPATIDAPPGRYYVSVLPYSGYSISGRGVEVIDGTETVTVTVQQHPIPTAQIALYLFHDNFPVNGAPDLPEETNPLPGEPGHVDWSQFNVLLEEPAGRYGIAGGQVIQDAFGNPLGTEYDRTCDATGANPGTGTNACLDVDGNPIVLSLGDGTIQPLSDGTLLIKNLAPGKYGIVINPPTGSTWQQTTTIEGTKVIDAWVKANEPPFFVEFGPPGPHVFMGFVQPFNNLSAASGATLSGTITDMHMSRPPNFEFFSGRDFPSCWIAVNEANPAGLGAGLYAGPCNGSDFSIQNVPPGSYQLKVFDSNLDAVIASQGFTVDADGINCDGGLTAGCAFGEVAVFNWFTRLNTGIFNDVDQDGFWDEGETGIGPESQDVSLRWRDGTIYQNFPTDGEGLAPFDEVFPFFHWLVAEVSFANKKATGATFVVDAGGFVDKSTDAFPGFGELTPLAQFDDDGVTALPDCDLNPAAEVCTTDGLSRTERGPVLTTGFQGFLGQTSVMHWGKTDYVNFDFNAVPPTYVGENGGISGIVYYATTRAEDEPQLAAAEEWEPGVPRVQVNLYADGDIDSFPLGDFPGVGDVDWNEDGIRDLDNDFVDDIDGNGCVGLADVDNYPYANTPINIDFQPPGTADSVYSGRGILSGVTDTIWNSVAPGGASNLTFADGSASSVSIATTFNASFSNLAPPYTGPYPATNALLADRLYGTPSTATQTITLSGLAPDSAYDLVFYNGYYAQEYSVNGQLVSIDPNFTNPPSTSDSANLDYPDWTASNEFVRLNSVMTDGAGQLVIQVTPFNGITGFNPLNSAIAGLQIQSVDSESGRFPGPEDVDRGWQDDDPTTDTNSCTEIAGNGILDLHDAVQVTWTDSWDDSLPTGCQGANNLGDAPYVPAVEDKRCFDGLRNFNQVRPGVFDGGYAFADYDLGHLAAARNGVAAAAIQAFYTSINATVPNADKLQLGLIPGDYIVEAATPPGYKLMKEEDKNVDFGDAYIPSPQAIAATCVGDDRVVPPYLSMTTKDGSGAADQLITGIAPADAAAPFAGEPRPLCDRKRVTLSAAQNAAAEFWVMTDVPIAGNISGVILNDLGNEFNPNSPAFGEKYAPPNVPVGFYDWNGAEVARVYADTNGRYNLVVPSTYTTNLPQPSGMSPNMLVSCMNDAGIGAEPDSFWNPQFSQFCYTFQYMPGAITYLDTPVEPIAAFASPITYPTDCERPATTPMIASVTRDTLDGPYAFAGETILIDSMGLTEVDNPDWDGTTNTTRKITRDYSFNGCTVELENSAGIRTPLTGVACGAAQASGVVPAVDAGAYQVVVINTDGAESPIGVTLQVGSTQGQGDTVWRVPGDFTTIQDAIDAAGAGDIILVGPKADGTQYDELVVMWKPVKLQGWGAGAVTINARQVPTEKVANWRTKVAGLIAAGDIDQLPGQEVPAAGFAALAEAVFPTEEGAGIFVTGKSSGNNFFGNPQNRGARIDGFSIVGASTGGGIVVNGYAEYLEIGNNRITGNAGAFGGGIRVGHPQLITQQGNTDIYTDAENDFIRVHHNHIARNGGRGGAGGGLSLHTGADEYAVEQNWICGNFSSGSGAGIGHLGLSDNGVIEDNTILFNESFAQAGPTSGGGIFIAGQSGLVPDNAGLLLSPGSGSVTVDSNVIRGNLAGAGDGGGIQLLSVNGEDVTGNANSWHSVDIVNNMINNNVAGLAGGGIAIQDAVDVSIQNNTVAHNESTATAALAFSPGTFNVSNATPAGIVARTHSIDFGIAMGETNVAESFSNPAISDSIIEHNRSFYWLNFDDPLTPAIETGLFPANCTTAPTGCDLTNVEGYTADLAVMDGPFTVADPVAVGTLDPQFSLLSSTVENQVLYIGTNGNVTGDPGFVNGYFNGALNNEDITEFTTLSTAGAFDEGGNFIQVAFRPLSLVDSVTGNLLDYHVTTGSAAIDAGNSTLSPDIDGDVRPQDDPGVPNAVGGNGSDIGADEVPIAP